MIAGMYRGAECFADWLWPGDGPVGNKPHGRITALPRNCLATARPRRPQPAIVHCPQHIVYGRAWAIIQAGALRFFSASDRHLRQMQAAFSSSAIECRNQFRLSFPGMSSIRRQAASKVLQTELRVVNAISSILWSKALKGIIRFGSGFASVIF